MAEICDSAEKYQKPTSLFFKSQRLFTNFTSKGIYNNESETTIMSPTSILDTKPFSCLKNPFWSEPTTPTGIELLKRTYWDNTKIDSKKSKGVGLGIIDSLVDDDDNVNNDKKCGGSKSKPETRMVLLGSQLKIQIPSMETRDDESSSSSCGRAFKGCLSASEMELSEDYTRVISRGPNPRTTHIFDNCIVDSNCFEFNHEFSRSVRKNEFLLNHCDDDDDDSFPSNNFLSSCFYCKKHLDQGTDIFMYR